MARRAAVLLAVLVSGVCVAGCAGGGPGLAGQPPHRGGTAVTYVSAEELGGGSQDPRLAWPDIFAQSSLPYWATTYALDVEWDWVFDVPSLVSQVKALRPTLVTVELGMFEALNAVPAWQFSQSLSQLLSQLKASGRRVLVGNVPTALGPASLLAQYNTDIASDAKAAGARLVDISGAVARGATGRAGALISGGVLTASGQRVVAATFAAALKQP
ncbi:MAG: hypothetical protein ACRD0Z_04395 [Acidimicrobiales bacterium]